MPLLAFAGAPCELMKNARAKTWAFVWIHRTVKPSSGKGTDGQTQETLDVQHCH